MLPRPSPNVVFCPVESGAVLLHSADEVYFGLNGVGAEIWQLLPPVSASLDELVSGLSSRYADVAPEVLRADAIELLETLRQNGLVLADDA